MANLTRTARSYNNEQDLIALADLINTCAAEDKEDDRTSVSQLKHSFSDPSFDPQQNLRLWEGKNGQFIGSGGIWIMESADEIEGALRLEIHPSFQTSDLGDQIIAWANKRMEVIAKDKNAKVAKLRCIASEKNSTRITLLEKNGFQCDRYFFDMTRSLNLPLQTPPFPPGFSLHQVIAHQDDAAWVEMFNETFIDHWNHYDMSVEQYQYYLQHPHFRPELHFVALSPEGKFAAFCYCQINREENARKHTNEGWINILGTRRGFRKQGLGRAMLLSGLHKLKAAGMDTAKLGVDTENPSQALKLYESVGFISTRRVIAYVKEVRLVS